jgi:ubiquinone/menaquinone biosynthesis C-methylase UbiE
MQTGNSLMRFLKAMSDPTRVSICAVLYGRELSVNEIVDVLAMGQSRISRHLKIIADCGILTCRRDGLWSFYTVSPDGEGRRFVDAIAYSFDCASVRHDISRAEKVLKERDAVTIKYFNGIASDWDRERREILSGYDLNGAASSLLEGAVSVADLGCGNGEISCGIARKGFTVIGIDSSPKMIGLARKKAAMMNITLDLRIGELEHLPVKDSEVDGALMALSLHHTSSPGTAIRELSRILTQGGIAIIADFTKHTNEAMRERYHDLWLGFSRQEIARWFEGADLSMKSFSRVRLSNGLTLALYKAVKGEKK